MSENLGGIEKYILNCIKALENTEYNIFVLKQEGINIPLKEEFTKLGVKILELPISFKHPLSLIKKWKRALQLYNINLVYFNFCTLENMRVFSILKYMGVKEYIIHSHSRGLRETYSSKEELKFKKALKNLKKYNCKFVACSQEAGEWMFGENERFEIIPNSINLKQFSFKENEREEERKKEQILDNQFVLGTIGMLSRVKNTIRIVEIFSCLKKRKKDCILMIIGEGPEKDNLLLKIKELQLEDSVILLGKCDEEAVSRYLQIFDYFIFPSIREGFGFTLLEAQAVGLRCITSLEGVVQSLNVTGNVTYFSLNENNDKWAEKILEDVEKTYFKRENKANILANYGYSMSALRDKLLEILK